jgi:hypothetical protein
MAKLTKTQIRDFVRTKLETDPRWAKAALLKIYEFQTSDEQISEYTRDHNGVGFTGIDGQILTSFAKQLNRKGYLSPRQMELVMKKMPKYWRQIISISNRDQLNSLILKS